MMAKMFYTLEETQTALGRSGEDIKQLTREGKLREFRDGAKVMYKADQVEALKGEFGIETGGGSGLDLGPSDTGGPLGLADSASGTSSGSMIGLADTGSGSPISGSGGPLSKDDTATDIGLSASSSGSAIPLAGSLGGSMGGSMSRTGTGVNVLGAGEGGADPSAQTAVSSSFSGEGVNLEAMGSGSGLLDLSRERDDTSLGEPVLGEIESGGSRAGAVSGPALTGGMGVRGVGPAIVEAADPLAPAFGGMALAASAVVVVAILALALGVSGVSSNNEANLLKPLMVSSTGGANPWYYVFGGGFILAAIFFVAGMVIGKKK
jgi:hypothetical protein